MAASARDSTAKAILYAFLANFGIASTWASIVTDSGSMLAEAIHYYADTGNQVLPFLGLKRSQKPADDEHPLGYGKLSYFWSFIVAICEIGKVRGDRSFRQWLKRTRNSARSSS